MCTRVHKFVNRSLYRDYIEKKLHAFLPAAGGALTSAYVRDLSRPIDIARTEGLPALRPVASSATYEARAGRTHQLRGRRYIVFALGRCNLTYTGTSAFIRGPASVNVRADDI